MENQSNEQKQPNPNTQTQLGSSAELETDLVLKINGDAEDSLPVWLPRIIVTIIVITIFLLKLALPTTFKTLTNQIAFQGSPSSRNCNPSAFDPNKKLYCLNFTSSNPQAGLLVRDLRPENQFIVFYFQFFIPDTLRQQAALNQSVQIEAHQVIEVTYVETDKKQIFEKKMIYNQTSQYLYLFKDFRGKGVEKEGKKYTQYEIAFAYDRVTVNEKEIGLNLLVLVKFSNFTQLSSALFQIKALTMSAAFTHFTIIVRAVYCFISIVTAIVFLRRYWQLDDSNRILEIKLVAFASLMLIFFNDPFYAVTVLKINPVTTFFSVFYAVNLFVFLIGLWIFFLRRIYYEPNKKESSLAGIKQSWPFYVILVVIYAMITTMFLQYSYYVYEKIPILVPSDLKEMKVIPTIVVVAVVLAVAMIYQLVMFVMVLYRQCCQENTMRQRHRSYLSFYPFFVVMFIIFFAAGGAMPYSYDGAWILYGYSFMNIFVYILQYLYYTPVAELKKQLSNGQPSIMENVEHAGTSTISKEVESNNLEEEVGKV